MAQVDPESVPISTTPAPGQVVEHGGKTYTTVKEGLAYILVPPNARTSVDPQAKSKADDGSHAQSVFYNPIQQFNRDLSVLAIRAFSEDAYQRKRIAFERTKGTEQKKRANRRERQRVKLDSALSDEQQRVKDVEHVANDTTIETTKRKQAELDDGHSDGARAEKVRKLGGANAKSRNGVSSASNDEGRLNAATGQDGSEAAPGVASTSLNTTKHHVDPTSESAATESDQDRPWRPRFRILDALSATGLRALRYAAEISNATSIIANDRDKGAAQSIGINIEHNDLNSKIAVTTGDAIGHMYSVAFPPAHSHGSNHVSGKYDVIDLDPYGTAAPFIDAALQALNDGGMLCVTCTDSGVFASCGYSEKTFALYGGLPIKGNHSHEGGLRLILHAVATTASRYGLAIEPLLSLSIDYYTRLFIRVRRSPNEVKFLAGKTMLVYSCDAGCGAWTTQFLGRHQLHKDSQTNWKFTMSQAPSADRHCEHCGSKTHVAGPMWGGPIHNAAFIEKIMSDLETVDADTYNTKPRIEGMLDTALDELSVNPEALNIGLTTSTKDGEREIVPRTLPHLVDHHPFYFIPSSLCKVVKAQAPPEALLRGALRHAGYTVARTHCKPGCIKTDAPWDVIWEVMREWVRQRAPVKEGALKEGQAGYNILQAMRGSSQGTTAGNDTANGKVNGHDDEGTSKSPEVIIDPRPPAATDDTPDVKRNKVIFDAELGRDKPGKRLVRYQMNPRENWGPMTRAKGTG